MEVQIRTKSIDPLLRPCSAARVSENTIYVSGTHAIDDNGELVGPGDIVAQTTFVIQKLRHILAFCADTTLHDIVFNQIILSNMSDYEGMNSVYREHFRKFPPARSCICAELIKPEYLIEIASVAHIKPARTDGSQRPISNAAGAT